MSLTDRESGSGSGGGGGRIPDQSVPKFSTQGALLYETKVKKHDASLTAFS